MAPSRKKGAAKAAAAAAARRQWKVGDLVLAKVKGFPAWPATVSEPEKWGYSADWKKVLVYFFGTQQIAFCNPADVEAFTEEKKQSLLVKRQGKGADFVRAVQEIIDSFEKSKKQDQVDEFNSGDEVTVANGGNSVDSSAQVGLKDQTEASEATLDSRLKTSNSSTARNDPSHPNEDAPAAAQTDSLNDKEASLEQPTDNVVAKSMLTTYSSRKRSGLRSKKCVSQRKAPSGRSRSSSRVESYKFQDFMMPCSDGDKSAGDISANVTRDGSLRRTKRIRKSPDASEWDDVDSSAFISNGSIEDDGSEIVTVDSDTSLNEGSTIDSGCKLEHSETVCERLERDVELGKGLDFQIKAVVIKKKRKPNRKRVTNDAAEPPARMDMEADLEVGMQNVSKNSQNAYENMNERYSKEDGDEHLPLVKRARVRMGKPSSLEEQLNIFSQTEEKPSNDVTVNMSEQISTSSNCDDDSPGNRDSSVMKGAVDNLSPSKGCTQIPENRPQLWKLTKSQSFGCSGDGEAALPPSKRLHRALEAMSANAAEEGQACVGASSTMKTTINDCCVSSMKICSNITMESKEGNALGTQSADALGKSASGFCSSSNPIVLEESIKFAVEADSCNQPIEISKSQVDKIGKGVFVEPMDYADDKDHSGPSCGAHAIRTRVQTQSPEHLSPHLDKREVSPRSNQGSLDHLLPLKDQGNTENTELTDFRAETSDKELDTSEHTKMSPNPFSGAHDIAKVSPEKGTNVLQYSEEGTGCENAVSSKSQFVDSSKVNSIEEVVKEVKHRQKNTSSVSDDHLGARDVSGFRLSPLPADGVGFPAQVSPPNTSVCHVSTSESANFVQNNGSHLYHKKTLPAPVADEGKIGPVVTQRPKSVGKGSNFAEAHAALLSFEATLGSLTRTKESIGRATRIAIDCAKFGVSAKVVEILARNLESESSLHKRVDLFFLVDSITQCSRGWKGDCGIYPSAIQAVLPRLLSAAAPPGSVGHENRRQCLKVLRLWLERKILPESVVRHHMRELDSLNGSSSAGAYSRRSARTERALDDPVRDMEGMLVDEYGSNSSFQLPGFCMPRMLKDEDEGSDSDGESFEAVTPEHNSETPEEREVTTGIEKHRHILEDVDGELEMEDVAPSCEVEMSSTSSVAGVNTVQTSHDQFEQHYPVPFAPPLPQDVPPSSPPLPSSPPPPPPPPPTIPAPCAMLNPYSNGVDSKIYNMQGDLRQPAPQQSVTPKINPTMSSNVVHYNTPECRDPQMPMQISDSTSSFSSFPGHPVSNIHETDGRSFHHKAYPPRPPHRPPPNQFSYVQAGQHVKSRREAPPPPYDHRFHCVPNVDGNFYNNHERMKPAPYELRENWRFPAPPFSGPLYPDKAKECYAPGSYVGPQCEPTRLPNQGWSYPPRGMNHRNSWPIRPPSEGPVPVGIRAPGIWRPR